MFQKLKKDNSVRKRNWPCDTIVGYGNISSPHLGVYFQAELYQGHIIARHCIFCLNALSRQAIFPKHLSNFVMLYFGASILSFTNSLEISCNEKQNIDYKYPISHEDLLLIWWGRGSYSGNCRKEHFWICTQRALLRNKYNARNKNVRKCLGCERSKALHQRKVF